MQRGLMVRSPPPREEGGAKRAPCKPLQSARFRTTLLTQKTAKDHNRPLAYSLGLIIQRDQSLSLHLVRLRYVTEVN